MKLVELSVEVEVKELVVIDSYKSAFLLTSHNRKVILMVIIGPMSNNTPGSFHAVQLVPNPKSLKLELCFICQNVKDSAGSSKLTSTEAGRQTIISTSRKLEDGLVTNIDQNRLFDVRYDVKFCYATYKKKGAIHKVESPKRKLEEPDLSPLMSQVTRPKRFKTITSPDPRDKLCVICNHVKCQGDTKRFWIESSEEAESLLKAANFNKDEIHIRLIFLKETGDIWTKNIIPITVSTSISASFSVTPKNC